MILQKRYHYIDVAKLMGLYLMILCHQTLVSSNISSFVYSFHMPLFFIISGMLMSYNKPQVTFARYVIDKANNNFVFIEDSINNYKVRIN